MENNNNINEFFDFINKECLFYSISITHEGEVNVKWENMRPDDYIVVPSIINKINLRVQKTKDKPYFLDFFQYSQNRIEWKGFRMLSCSSYELQTYQEEGWFDAVFHFGENRQLYIRRINTQVFLILQDFFSGFI